MPPRMIKKGGGGVRRKNFAFDRKYFHNSRPWQYVWYVNRIRHGVQCRDDVQMGGGSAQTWGYGCTLLTIHQKRHNFKRHNEAE